jgi:site-specific DNA recombinase
MSILVLEDNPERQRYFRDRFPGCVVVASYGAALAAFLGAHRYDEVYLDHDIEFGHNGCDVAYWMTGLPRAQWPAAGPRRHPLVEPARLARHPGDAEERRLRGRAEAFPAPVGLWVHRSVLLEELDSVPGLSVCSRAMKKSDPSLRRLIEQIRVSSKGQNARDTPEVQRHELDAWRARDPGILVERIEHVGTGTLGIRDRPDLQRMKVLADSRSFDELRLYSVSRASRSEDVQDQVEVFHLCQQAGAVIRVSNGAMYNPKEQWDFVRWVIDIGAAAADRRQILKNTSAGKSRALRAGGKPAGPTPYGLDYDAEEQRWSIDNEQAKWVRRMYEWCREGVGALEIVRRLNDGAAPSPRGTGWARTTMLRILRSRVYVGEYAYRIGEEAPVTVSVPPIVPFDAWEQVQASLDGRRNRPQRDGYVAEALLRQYVECGVCESPMHVWMQSAKLGKKGRVYYRCASIQNGKPCGNGYHQQKVIDEATWEALVAELRQQRRLARMAMEDRPQKNTWREKIADCEKALAKVKSDEARVFRMMDSGLAEDAGREKLEELKVTRKRLLRQLDDAKKCLEDEAAAAVAFQSLKDRIALMESKLDGAATFEDRRDLLVLALPLGGRVVIDKYGEVGLRSLALVPSVA